MGYILDCKIKLIKSDYLIDTLYCGNAMFEKRQNMREEAFVQDCDLESLIEYKRIIIVSHPWLSLHHPDPHRIHLKLLVERGGDGSKPLERGCGIFFDYSCLWQVPRGTNQEQEFRTSLKNMHILYAHDYTKVVRLEEVPDWAESSKKYMERGWCSTEARWSGMKNRTLTYRAGDAVDGGTTDEILTPMTPREYLAALVNLHFTSKRSDFIKVAKCYEMVFEAKAHKQESLCMKVDRVRNFKQFRPFLDAALYYTKLKIVEIDISKSKSFEGDDVMGLFADEIQWVTVLNRISPPLQEIIWKTVPGKQSEFKPLIAKLCGMCFKSVKLTML